jgi:hypothetical protein
MPTLTTELEAVNSMLGHIGETPVNTLSNATALPVSASTAIAVLNEVNREVQNEGWYFNTENNVTLSPDVDGNIVLDKDVVEADAVDNTLDIAQRGLNLYDRKNNTLVFTKDVKVTLTRLLDWDYLPEPARRYITLRASRTLQGRLVGSRELEALILRDELLAKARLEDYDSNSSDRTMFDNYDAASRIGINRNYDLI